MFRGVRINTARSCRAPSRRRLRRGALCRAKAFRRTNAAGFTLIELLVVIVIGAILIGLAVPALQNLIVSNQLTGITGSFATALNEARSEAGKLGVPVSLTPNGGSNRNWGSVGWSMAAVTGALGTLRNAPPLPTGFTLDSASFPNGVTFDSTGRLVGASGQFMFCQGGGPGSGGRAQLISVTASGRVRVAQKNASGYPIDPATNNPVMSCTP